MKTKQRINDLNTLIEESISVLNDSRECEIVKKKLVMARALTGAIKHDIELLANKSSDGKIDNDLFGNYKNVNQD